jgi:serine/threonine protein kinase
MLCPGCFVEKGSVELCPECGYDESPKRSPIILAHHTLLNNGRYIAGKLLGKPGGFGITYLGWDNRLLTKVAIKEYLPRDLSGRDTDHLTVSPHSKDDAETFEYGLIRFVDEARTLAQLDHPSVVRVRDFFEENGTAYLVMDYYEGLTLSEYISHQPTARLSESQALNVISPILDGLREVHAKGFLHRDIKPQNIYLTVGNRPILLDFGAARFAMGERSRSLSVVLSEGYAPIEQYQRNGKQGPWTDVYGAAATLFVCVTGKTPPTAMDRLGAVDVLSFDGSEISNGMMSAIQAGMRSDSLARIQTIEEFQTLLFDSNIDSRSNQPEPVGGLDGAKYAEDTVTARASVSSGTDLQERTEGVAKAKLSRLESEPSSHLYVLRKWIVPFFFVVVLGLILFIVYIKSSGKKVESVAPIIPNSPPIDRNQQQQTPIPVENEDNNPETPKSPPTPTSSGSSTGNDLNQNTPQTQPADPTAPAAQNIELSPQPNTRSEESPNVTEQQQQTTSPVQGNNKPKSNSKKTRKQEANQRNDKPKKSTESQAITRENPIANTPAKPKPKPNPRQARPRASNPESSGPSALDLKIRRDAEKFFFRR